MAADRQHAHQLLDQLGPGQLAAVVHLLETMISPDQDSGTLSNAERKAVAEADEWLKHNQPIPHEEVLAEFGLTMRDESARAEAESGHPPAPAGMRLPRITMKGRSAVWVRGRDQRGFRTCRVPFTLEEDQRLTPAWRSQRLPSFQSR